MTNAVTTGPRSASHPRCVLGGVGAISVSVVGPSVADRCWWENGVRGGLGKAEQNRRAIDRISTVSPTSRGANIDRPVQDLTRRGDNSIFPSHGRPIFDPVTSSCRLTCNCQRRCRDKLHRSSARAVREQARTNYGACRCSRRGSHRGARAELI